MSARYTADGLPLLLPLKRYTDSLRDRTRGRRSTGSATIQPREITRVDQIWMPTQHSESPMLDISEIIRAKDELAATAQLAQFGTALQSPHSASADSEQTLSSLPNVQLGLAAADGSPRSTVVDSSELPASETLCELRSASLDVSRARGTAGMGEARRLRHDYFRVATMDGKPRIPPSYHCPIAMCGKDFVRFEQLQAHWTEHPWNRGGILTPVCEGGVRRLGWWEHKRKYFASLVHGRFKPEFPEFTHADSQAARQRRRASMDEVCRLDYGDISFGSRTYCVSPRIVPMWQVAQWEDER
ncbi:hypothetical protein LPJ78_000202 [Coemansia sp. RSA 989]|nr:hypothetical protein BX667DRAFT_506998 [Coemansia mojavensis]KAJ1742465.1 hypothetical protein LPJ68_001893 [Coemansia sp. RSA 1086]KAJ1751759.1 hypothetical protein LPJ79_001827 [Coemansia sp. RSA 1821]KAJ1868454.1 hypothetical protein LPJ78_000202 [Coemansia sp. RSA 989]KAJ1875113.1 hypothetical protein LPJ55_000924 [Coemansia sp. RSA 990]KAJ2675161.1 hypothetical protein IWW42_001307 [Coemansia sp. RSA 1085]